MNNQEKNSWTTLDNKTIYENTWIKVTEYNVLNPSGKSGIYGVVSFKGLAIGILPLDKDYNTWLVGQWRYPLKQYSWEIPEGGGNLSIDPVETAKRELKEETGLIAEQYQELCRMNTSNSVCDELAIIYIATGLTQAQAEPEDTEDLKVKKLPFEEAYQLVMRGEIADSLTMVAVLKTKILIDKGLI